MIKINKWFIPNVTKIFLWLFRQKPEISYISYDLHEENLFNRVIVA